MQAVLSELTISLAVLRITRFYWQSCKGQRFALLLVGLAGTRSLVQVYPVPKSCVPRDRHADVHQRHNCCGNGHGSCKLWSLFHSGDVTHPVDLQQQPQQ